jgi:hypothetical protein
MPPGCPQKCLAGVREPHHVVGAFDEVHSQLGFELPDLLAQRGLGHARPLGGPTKMKFIGHHHEIAQMANFDHRSSPQGALPTGHPLPRGQAPYALTFALPSERSNRSAGPVTRGPAPNLSVGSLTGG